MLNGWVGGAILLKDPKNLEGSLSLNLFFYMYVLRPSEPACFFIVDLKMERAQFQRAIIILPSMV